MLGHWNWFKARAVPSFSSYISWNVNHIFISSSLFLPQPPTAPHSPPRDPHRTLCVACCWNNYTESLISSEDSATHCCITFIWTFLFIDFISIFLPLFIPGVGFYTYLLKSHYQLVYFAPTCDDVFRVTGSRVFVLCLVPLQKDCGPFAIHLLMYKTHQHPQNEAGNPNARPVISESITSLINRFIDTDVQVALPPCFSLVSREQLVNI